jgi:RNA polymerase sigma-70 factor (ECF subfamily)
MRENRVSRFTSLTYKLAGKNRAMTDDATQTLLRLAADGDEDAQRALLSRYRAKLVRLIQIRMDEALSARFDPSDVVQETLLDAARNLQECFTKPGRSFYAWLRGLALNRLIDLYRQHVLAGKRSLHNEQLLTLPEGSKCLLADRFVAQGPSPSQVAMQRETQRRLRNTIEAMEPEKREVLVMRYLEELSVEEMSEILGVSVRTVWRWHRLAVSELAERLQEN